MTTQTATPDIQTEDVDFAADGMPPVEDAIADDQDETDTVLHEGAASLSLADVFESAGISESVTAKFRASGIETIADIPRWLGERSTIPGELFNRLVHIVGEDSILPKQIIAAIAKSRLTPSQPHPRGTITFNAADSDFVKQVGDRLRERVGDKLIENPLGPSDQAAANGNPERPNEKKPATNPDAPPPKAVKVLRVQFFECSDDEALEMRRRGEKPVVSEPYRLLSHLIGQYHTHLAEAKIALLWKRDVKPDRDGRLELGKAKKVSDADKEFSEYDFIISLNELAWDDLKINQRIALMDHELCHCQVTCFEDGEVKRDERNRICYRIKKHDVEEFAEIVERHGIYKLDLELFARAMQRGKQGELFPNRPATGARN